MDEIVKIAIAQFGLPGAMVAAFIYGLWKKHICFSFTLKDQEKAFDRERQDQEKERERERQACERERQALEDRLASVEKTRDAWQAQAVDLLRQGSKKTEVIERLIDGTPRP